MYLKSLITRFSIFLLFQFALLQFAKASHIAGGEITYECLGNDSFLIKLNVYRDCSGKDADTTVNVLITSTCDTFNVTLKMVNRAKNPTKWLNAGDDISQFCSISQNQSSCKGGNLPGFALITFEKIIVLPPCNYKIAYSPQCCGIQSVNVVNSFLNSPYIKMELNTAVACGSGPKLIGTHTPYFCVGQKGEFSFSATDNDGDSIVYSLISGYIGHDTIPKIFDSIFSFSEPLPGGTINSKTGQLTFFPTIIGKYVVVVLVEEYNNAGQLISSTMRETIFEVVSCVNKQPLINQTINHISKRGINKLNNELVFCNSKSSFSIIVFDPDTSDYLTVESNISDVIPGAKFNITYPHPNRFDTAIVNFSWDYQTNLKSNYYFDIVVKDQNCPIYGLAVSSFKIKINQGIFAEEDIVICQGTQEALLSVKGGTQFLWTALQGGDSLVVGTPGVGNFSCDTCNNPIAYPNISTCYEATSNLNFGCKLVDTVCVTVSDNFEISTLNDTLICATSAFQLQVFENIPDTYSYSWINDQNTLISTLSNPVVKQNKTTTYTVNVTSNTGCTKQDSVTITSSTKFPGNSKIKVLSNYTCNADTLNFKVELGELEPLNCGFYDNNCLGFDSTVYIAYGGFYQFNYAKIFDGKYKSNRFQVLFRKNDLLGFGLKQGYISEISLNLLTLNSSANSFYENFTIKMGCTNKNELENEFENDLHTVFLTKNVAVANGINTFTFDNFYDWDGQSNIIVDFCYADTLPVMPDTFLIQAKVINYVAIITASSNNEDVCSVSTPNNVYKQIPNIYFKNCYGANPQNFTFNWLNNPNLINPQSNNSHEVEVVVDTLNSNFFQVVISDTNGICFDTLKKQITVVSEIDATIIGDSIFCGNSTNENLLATNTGGVWEGVGISNDSLGIFNPSITGAGFHKIKYTIFGSNCIGKDSILIKVDSVPNPTISSKNLLCSTDSNVLITPSTSGYFSSKNQNFKPTIIDSSGIFDLTKLTTNEDTFLITFNTVNGSCWRSKDFAIPITNPFEPKITAVTSLCENISIVQLKSSLQGGLWSGTRILDTKNGIYNISGLTAGQSFVARIDSMGYCGGFATRKFYIDSVTDIYFTFNTGYKGPFCKGENVNVNFVGNPINDTNLYGEGIWKHAGNWLGNQQNQTFNPSNSSIKDGIFTSEYTFTNLNGCISSKSIKFIIYPSKLSPKIVYEKNTNRLIVEGFLGQNLTYNWFRNGIQIPNVLPTDSIINVIGLGYYKVEVTSNCGSGASNVYQILPTNIESIATSSFKIHPNPNTGSFFIEFENLDFVGSQLMVFNALGQKIMENPIIDKQIEVTGLKPGVYYLKTLKNGFSQKVVVTK